MTETHKRKMSLATISMLIVVSTFGLTNVIDNLVELGLAAIPSWLVVSVVYFLPLALILAEFASDTREARGGIYSYMERGLGPVWAFVGTWSYFAANLVYLQSSFSRTPIRASLAVTGVDVFESAAVWLPPLGIALCLVITYISSRGVGVFSTLAKWSGWVTLAMVGLLVFVPSFLGLTGMRNSATTFALGDLVPSLDLAYFSTFSWLLFAVAGAEVAAPYVKESEDPQRTFPRAILVTTLLIGGMYILGTIAVSFLVPLEELDKSTGLFVAWFHWGEMLGLSGEVVGRIGMTLYVLGAVVAYVIWVESPIRAMFAEVPEGTFPSSLTQRDAGGTHIRALWIQALVVVVLTLLPLFSILTGMDGSERLLGLLNDMASLSLVVPYVFIALAYIQARRKGMDAPFKMVRSTRAAVGIGIVVLIVSLAGYLGAGLYALDADPVDWTYVGVVYAGPLALIVFGLLIRSVSMKAARSGR